MLVQIGKREPVQDVVGMLVECHRRIRTFLHMARRLAEQPPDERDARDAADQISHYFRDAFPLHLEDEDREIATRLRGMSPDVDRALEWMAVDHERHAPAITQLVDLCAMVSEAPSTLGIVAAALQRLVNDLAARLGAHLELEERVIFPAIRRLPAFQQAAIMTAFRDRRERRLERIDAQAWRMQNVGS